MQTCCLAHVLQRVVAMLAHVCWRQPVLLAGVHMLSRFGMVAGVSGSLLVWRSWHVVFTVALVPCSLFNHGLYLQNKCNISLEFPPLGAASCPCCPGFVCSWRGDHMGANHAPQGACGRASGLWRVCGCTCGLCCQVGGPLGLRGGVLCGVQGQGALVLSAVCCMNVQ
jgi:hypothetical protein